MVDTRTRYKYSGHETFPCRYAWLPKVVSALAKDTLLFTDEDRAMIELGVGKNMVRAIRFWTETASVAERRDHTGHRVTTFGRELLGEKGLDPYMEDSQTLWLLHWKLATQYEEPLFAWDFMFNRWQEPEFTRTLLLRAFAQETHLEKKALSTATLSHHIDTFIHTYVPTQGTKTDVMEENLDCPLVELNLIRRVGERDADATGGRRETIYAFRHEPKPEIGTALFLYVLADFFHRRHPHESTLSFRQVATGHGSPGAVFKMPEMEVRERLEASASHEEAPFGFEDGASSQQVRRRRDISESEFLAAIYERETACV